MTKEPYVPSDPLIMYKTQNGFILHDQPQSGYPLQLDKQFVFRNVDELCEWIKKNYFEHKRIEEL